jgi:hypothetical protein
MSFSKVDSWLIPSFWHKENHKADRKRITVCSIVAIAIIVTAINGSISYADESHAPVISNFVAEEGLLDYWTFSGTVTDIDYDVAGMPIFLGGVLFEYGIEAIVEADGSFSVTVELPGLQSGIATAQTFDYSENYSDVAQTTVAVGG